MKSLLIIFLLVACGIKGLSQKTELMFGGQLNFQTFHGNGAYEYTVVNKHSIYNTGYANDRFGKSADAGYGIDFTLHRTTKYGMLLGLLAGSDLLKNRIKINWISTISGRIPAEGKTTFKSYYAGAGPFLGYRFRLNKILSLDLNGFMIFYFPIHQRQGSGRAVSADGSLTVNIYNFNEGKDFDVLTGGMMALNKGNFAFTLTWAKGYANFLSSYIGSNGEAFQNILKTGIRYNWITPKKKKIASGPSD